ncbi:MAG: hypothetical protein AUJ92_17580 [Armatimonadetes bacterium CG2_30_59_28]|nr:MAG: hypothetical protein AUJ92_17580 [Armatimonadetes bacterium CG2_30_59_28]PIU66939.1 MAG: hypothetical protein COS85_02725 [Armatimonadetes bacterium CG07_land_8_20_14_0_80_59_28]PIY49316.1 MAG: hypothetical protein COZ05_00785 [Armatimonadetes bacterium CG_4_10_14_3_um_filter_59_10]
MAKKRPSKKSKSRGEVLVAIVNDKGDFARLKEEHWYRIPTDTAPRRFPPKWVAFYQTKIFGEEAHAVNYYARVKDIRPVTREELFPGDPPNPKSGRTYHRIEIGSLQRLPQPILSRRFRRIVFIPTTWEKLRAAAEINDLFDESSLEDRLWAELKREQISAERQWWVGVNSKRYALDFAVFCEDGKVDIEADGDLYHSNPEHAEQDNRRNNALAVDGWHVLRFTEHQIREEMAEYCLPSVAQTIHRLGGAVAEGKLHDITHGATAQQQFTLHEVQADYDVD